MRSKTIHVFQFAALSLLLLSAGCNGGGKVTETSGNPLWEGWYADPEGVVMDGECWIYPTTSARYRQQRWLDAFSSRDLVHWTKHERVLIADSISWFRQALWAPAMVKRGDTYYLYFAANDVHEGEVGGIGVATAKNPAGPFSDALGKPLINDEVGGIGVATAKNPAGPFSDALGKPLINDIVNGAQPIDQFVFRDDDGEYYMYYGGWGHCNVVRMGEDLTSIRPFPDGTMFREITPENYVEGPFMLKRNGTYYFMWSEGGWTGPSYHVAYAMADNPFGPFRRVGTILESDPDVATGAGHHSVIKARGKDEYYIIYHRRPLGETDGNHRVTCIDRLVFEKDGTIRPVKITFEGVAKTRLK